MSLLKMISLLVLAEMMEVLLLQFLVELELILLNGVTVQQLRTLPV